MASDKNTRRRACERVIASFRKLDMARHHAFSVFLLASFLAIFLLGIFGRAAEMAVLAGFSAVCMAFLKLDLFSEFSGAGFSAKLRRVEETVHALAVKETEVDPEPADDSTFGIPTVLQVSAREKDVLAVIERSRFTYRTPVGVAKELSLSLASTHHLLESLVEKGLVASVVTSRRRKLWNITEAGKVYLARSEGSGVRSHNPTIVGL